MNKKKLAIIGIVSAFLLIIVLGYFFFRNNTTDTEAPYNNSPFGSTGESNNSIREGGASEQNPLGNLVTNPIPQEVNTLWKISESPVSGATILETASGTLVRLVEKATGHVYEVNLKERSTKRISNTTIPKAERIVWGKNANYLLFQYENDGIIKTYYAQIGAATTSTTEAGLLNGKYLADNMSEVIGSPSGDKILYLLSLPDAGAIVVSNFDGSQESTLFVSRLSDWLLSWPKEGLPLIVSKPSASVDGYLYSIDSKTKVLNKELGDISGLTTLMDKGGNNILYSRSESGGFSLNLLNKKVGFDIRLYPTTLPEKCVWGTKNVSVFYCGIPKNVSGGDYPDIWYQGRVSFSDTLWQFDPETGATEQIIDPKEKGGEEIDVIDPTLSPSGNILIFRNKKDFSLWGLTLDPSKAPTFEE